MSAAVKTQGAITTNRANRDRVIAGFEDVLAITDDVGEALLATGRSYASLRRTLIGMERHDLVVKLTEWKARDNERLRFALGRQWQT